MAQWVMQGSGEVREVSRVPIMSKMFSDRYIILLRFQCAYNDFNHTKFVSRNVVLLKIIVKI